jgi:hypothetical protein
METMKPRPVCAESLLAGREALLMVFGHPDWAVALWAVATTAAQVTRAAVHEPGH